MTKEIDLSLAEHFFRISLNKADNPVFSVPCSELLQAEGMDRVLHLSKQHFAAPDLVLPASFIANAFIGICSTMQLYLSLYNKLLDLSLDHLTFQAQPHGALIYGSFQITHLEWRDLAEENRESVIMDTLTHFYRETINPVIEHTAQRAGIQPGVLWNQFGGKMAYLKDYILQSDFSDEMKERFVRDYELLIQKMSPSVFNRRKNPFKYLPTYIDNPRDPEKPIMMRSSCCMYYKRDNGELCYNCPRLSEEKRQEKKRKMEEGKNQSA